MTDELKATCTLPYCTFCTDIDQFQAVHYFLQESNAIEDVYNDVSLRQAHYAWEYLQKEPKLTGGVILKLHKILMLHQPLKPNERGYWRKRPVYIGGREGMAYGQIPSAMAQWLDAVKNTEIFKTARQFTEVEINKLPIIEERIKNNHVEYERIHPFIDGNGRTGRMLLNWQRLKAGLPLLIIHSENKQDYYEWFK